MDNCGVNRRTFLKAGAGLGGALALGGGLSLSARTADAAAPKEKTITTAGTVPERDFGKTGHRLPILGHGGSAMIDSDADKYNVKMLPLEERVKMVRHGYDSGIRYFDTARIYGESEGIMGEALHDVWPNVYLATKVLVFTPDGVRKSVENSLNQLKTDYIDAVQVHGPSIERLGYDGIMPVHEELVKLRSEGLLRFIGMTGHSRFDEMYKLVNSGGFDQLLIEFGYFKKGYNTRHSSQSVEWREMCVAKAHEKGMGIVAMKVMSAMVFSHNAKNIVPDYDAGAIAKLPAAAIRWVLNDKRVHLLNIGVSMPGDIDDNIKILKGDLTLTNDDRLLLADFSAKVYQLPALQGLKVV